MPFGPGARLGAYDVLAPLGAGGMGEVYRARDLKLRREVAIKVLPETFASDPERVARFAREAHLLATLNHPNIGGIYGLEESSGIQALVLELVEGPTLAERLAAGPIPLDETLAIALQICEALEAAHEKGIIHRDLKPANIKLTPDGRVKVLDFGLAKALIDDAAADAAISPTLTAVASRLGVIVGTAAYMSPEQAKGKSVDKRTDIWAFGCVLFEMLTGQSAFGGETIADVVAAVMTREPDLTALPATTPPPIHGLLRRCLKKDPRERLRDIGDARFALEDARSGAAASDHLRADPQARSRILPWGIVIGLTAAGAAALLMWPSSRVQPAGAPPLQVQIQLPPGLQLAVDTEHPVLALSPDGTQLAFVGDENGTRRLYLRKLADADARPIAGTEGAASPFFSPDGAWLGYYAGNSLAKIAVGGGVPVKVLVTTPLTVAQGATWDLNDTVVLAQSVNSGLAQASIAGDQLRPITERKALTESNLPYVWPSAIPDGQHVLFTDNSEGRPRIAVLAVQNGSIRTLVNGGTSPRYSPTGHILFARDGSLYSVPFDPAGAHTTGPEQKLLDGVMMPSNGPAQFSVAAGGVLAYVAGGHAPTKHELVWVDRQGKAETLLDSRDVFLLPRFSPDGRHLALGSFERSNLDVWRFDLARRTVSRVTTHSGEDFGAVWSPDGKTLALASESAEDEGEIGPGLAWIASEGRPERLVRSPGFGDWEFPSSWSPDGKWIAYLRLRGAGSQDVMLLPTTGPREPVAFLDGPANEWAAMFSPDGRWVAFVSDESNRPEIYVTPFPGPGPRIQLSTLGGIEPVWARTGRELFYRAGNTLMAVAFEGGSIESASTPRVLFEGRFEQTGLLGARTANYDVTPDGRRFVMVRRKNIVTPTSIHVVLNWPEALGPTRR